MAIPLVPYSTLGFPKLKNKEIGMCFFNSYLSSWLLDRDNRRFEGVFVDNFVRDDEAQQRSSLSKRNRFRVYDLKVSHELF